MNLISRLLFVAVAIVAFGSAALIGGGTAQADHEPATVTIDKVCLDEAGAEIDVDTEFNLLVDVEFDPEIFWDAFEDEDEAFDRSDLTIGCGDSIVLEWCQEAIAVAEVITVECALDDLIDFLVDECIFDIFGCDSATMTITETSGPSGVETSYEGCTIDMLDGDNWEAFEDDGLHCTITNVFSTPTLTLIKDCPNGPGDATSTVSVNGTASDFPCGANLMYGFEEGSELEPGTYTIVETISGVDAGNFLTAIVCDNGEGTTGTSLSIDLDYGDAVTCVVTNALFGVGLPGDLDGDGLLDLEIEIENELNNINQNINKNVNNNVNNNINENTQNQTNNQNTNVSTGDVNVSSSGGSGTGTGTGTGH